MMKNDPAVPGLQASKLEKDAANAPDTTPLQEQDVAAALLAVGGVADRTMVCRVQRCVREQALEMAEHRQRIRHSIGLTILGFSLLALVLTPVIWSCVHMEGGSGLDMQFVYMMGWLFPVTLMALVLVLMRTRPDGAMRRGGARQIDHRVASRLGSMVR